MEEADEELEDEDEHDSFDDEPDVDMIDDEDVAQVNRRELRLLRLRLRHRCLRPIRAAVPGS
eukprot:1318717-Prymnesium_polylepis.1